MCENTMLDLHMLFNLRCLKYVRIRFFSDPLFSRIRAESNSRRFCAYTEKCESEKTHILAYFIQSLREKCPNTEFFLVCVFLYSNWIPCIRTEYRKIRSKKTPYLDTFHAVSVLHTNGIYLMLPSYLYVVQMEVLACITHGSGIKILEQSINWAYLQFVALISVVVFYKTLASKR